MFRRRVTADAVTRRRLKFIPNLPVGKQVHGLAQGWGETRLGKGIDSIRAVGGRQTPTEAEIPPIFDITIK